MNIYKVWKNFKTRVNLHFGYNVVEVAWFIHRVLSERTNHDDILNIRISKYLYIANAWHMVIYNKPLVRTKSITLQSTPGYMEIVKRFNIPWCKLDDKYKNSSTLPVETKRFVIDVIDHYSKFKTIELNYFLTRIETPYNQIRVRKGYYKRIPNSMIKKYFGGLEMPELLMKYLNY